MRVVLLLKALRERSYIDAPEPQILEGELRYVGGICFAYIIASLGGIDSIKNSEGLELITRQQTFLQTNKNS